MKPLTFGIVLLLGCVALPAFGQNNNKKGYLVKNNGDTLRGWINYKSREKTPQEILFQSDSLNDNMVKFTIDDITSFEITGPDKYVKAIVEKDIRPVDANNLVQGTENMVVTDTVFLRQIVSGSKIDLYELVDSKSHFFIKEANEPYKELSYKVFFNERNNIATQKNYINQLRAVVGSNEIPASLENKINNADYEEQDLKEAVVAINKANGSVYYSTGTTSGSRIKASFFAGAGGGYSSLRFKGEQVYMGKMDFSGGFSPYFSVGMDLAEQRKLQALFIRIELSYYSVSYKGDGATASNMVDTSDVILKYRLTQQNVSPSISVLYSFVNKESYKIYAGFGVAYNFSSYPENKLTTVKPGNKIKEFENYIVPSKHWVSMNATLGMRITKHWDAAVKADVYGSFTNYPVFSLNSNTYTAQVRWFFN